MRVFQCPGAYARFVVSSIAMTLAEIQRDMDRRSDDHPGVRALAPIPDVMIDPENTEHVAILIGGTDHERALEEFLWAGATV